MKKEVFIWQNLQRFGIVPIGEHFSFASVMLRGTLESVARALVGFSRAFEHFWIACGARSAPDKESPTRNSRVGLQHFI